MGWTLDNSRNAIIYSLSVILLHILLFPEYIMSIPILIIGVVIIMFFFLSFNYYLNKWREVKEIERKIFLHSFLYRLIAVIGMYILTYIYDPLNLPMEFGAADAWNYHASGAIVSDAIQNDRSITQALSGFWKSENDYGFSIYIGLIYSLFGKNILIIKAINALWGSLTAVRIYQICKDIFDEESARISSILCMIFPSLLWFSSMMLKETILIFLLINITYYIIQISKSPEKWLNYAFGLLISLIPIYYFRVFLIPLIMFCMLLQLMFYQNKSKKRRFVFYFASISIMAITFYMINSFNMLQGFIKVFEGSSGTFNAELSNSAIQRGINYKIAVVAPFLVFGAIITPFPSLIHFNDEQIGIYMHYQNEIIRNIMYFFLFIAIYRLYKNFNKLTIFISSFALGYIAILAFSGVSFQDRFQVIALPFLLILMGYGIKNYTQNLSKKWGAYLFIITIAILSWNIFKLSIRGLV
jgi:4-amino-4-deoxy-L-arabinose transferase-like glycosyltransferase